MFACLEEARLGSCASLAFPTRNTYRIDLRLGTVAPHGRFAVLGSSIPVIKKRRKRSKTTVGRVHAT